ncbi:MAG: hypothetical protein UD936_02965 [Acutalibacteraceae bacterium]|nr:hypothetical protein [Acutalibacteraceae bacterium]
MFFLPKHFKYEVNTSSNVIADKIQEKIKPVGVKGADGDIYDFNGVVSSDSFELTLNPPYTPSVRKSIYTECIFYGGMKENNSKTTVDIKTKFSKRSIITMIFFVVFWFFMSVIVESFTPDSNLIESIVYTACALVVIYIVLGFFVNLTTRDTRERLESIFEEFGYKRIK